ncbi:DUF1801 domain-containing protein [Roseateles sp.]|jgi:hypothetical protein|uniref:DUF1801 domain-containing protein n=1 Tax=Roseateles sp. TaxID=1971397 RepID=UPI0037C569E3
MSEAKTRPTDTPLQSYLDSIADPQRRRDCVQLSELMQRLSGCPPVLWGSSIVGFGRYHYRYDSGRDGESCLVGFSARKDSISLYLLAGFEGAAGLLQQLGKHKTGKACLYIKRLANVQPAVLEQLIQSSIDETRRRWPGTA